MHGVPNDFRESRLLSYAHDTRISRELTNICVVRMLSTIEFFLRPF